MSPFDVFWYYAVPWLDAYSRQDYQIALEYAHKFNTPGFHWTYMYYTPAYAQLGEADKARDSLDRLLELNPNIAEDFRKECRIWNFSEPLIEHMVVGFRKAGLDIPDEATAAN